ncbi:MAG: potassium channel family protein [Acidobacteriota bacterium]
MDRINIILKGDDTLGLLAGYFLPYGYQIASSKSVRSAAWTICTVTTWLLLAMPLCIMGLVRSNPGRPPLSTPAWPPYLLAVPGVFGVGWLIMSCHWVPLAILALVALVYLWRLSRSGTLVFTAPVRRSAKVLCVAQLCVGAILALLLLCLTRFYGSWYPSLEPAGGQAFEKFDADRIDTTVKNLSRENATETLADLIDELPALHHLFSVRDADNPFGWSYLLACVYILLAVLILTICVLRPEMKRASLPRRLLAILISYSAVGFAFGIVYHLIYVGQIAKYNFFLASYFDRKPPRVSESRMPYVVDPRAVLGLIRARMPTLSVFVQDKPQFRSDAAQLREAEPFQATFLFASSRPELEPDKQFELNEGGRVPTNAQERARFEGFAKDLSTQPYPRGSPRYRVRIVGGADRRPYPQGQPDAAEGNEFLASSRAKQTRLRLLEWLREVAADHPASPQVPALRIAIDDAVLAEYTIQPKEQPEAPEVLRKLEILWPREIPEVDSPELDQARWRATSVTIWPLSPDPAASRASLEPGEPTLEDMLYFSFVSFTTTGYGDIKPVCSEARWWVVIENVLEVFLAGVFFSTIIRRKKD